MNERELDMLTHYCAWIICKRVMARTAPGLEIRQYLKADERIGALPPKLQRIWAIWDVHRDCWLDVFADPDNVPL